MMQRSRQGREPGRGLPPDVVQGGPLAEFHAYEQMRHELRTAVGAFPREISERLSRMDQSLDAIALEVERIGEGQRFLTRVYAEEQQRKVSPDPAERIETPEREKERQRRGS